MAKGSFQGEAATPSHRKWRKLVERQGQLTERPGDIRSEFARDYNRILHCTAYRRLKHKTQVFFATGNDHICTRMEHISHVASVSHTIASYLGLNTELTDAIAIGHDLGHAPFGHQGESILKAIAKKHLKERFWHEKNSLRFVEKIETLPNDRDMRENLLLTYGVRDGIVCHCGEVDQGPLFPRTRATVLSKMKKPSGYSPYTWEGCVVKIADKISYVGRDIEDALTLGLLSERRVRLKMAGLRRVAWAIPPGATRREINTTFLMHLFITDLCAHSSPGEGLRFSDEVRDLLLKVKEFNYEHIYRHRSLEYFKKYSKLIIESIFERLLSWYNGNDTIRAVLKGTAYPLLRRTFAEWLVQYSDAHIDRQLRDRYGVLVDPDKLANERVYTLGSQDDYVRAIIDYVSGMTDSFAIKVFGELTAF